jgi:hypothetical protein
MPGERRLKDAMLREATPDLVNSASREYFWPSAGIALRNPLFSAMSYTEASNRSPRRASVDARTIGAKANG